MSAPNLLSTCWRYFFFRSLHAGPQGIEEESRMERGLRRDGFGTWWHTSDIAAAKVGKVVNHPRYHTPTPWAAASHHITIMSSSKSYPISLFSYLEGRWTAAFAKVGLALAERCGSGVQQVATRVTRVRISSDIEDQLFGSPHEEPPWCRQLDKITESDTCREHWIVQFNDVQCILEWPCLFGMFLSFRTVFVRLFLMHLHHPVPSIIVAYLFMSRFWGLRCLRRRTLCAGTGKLQVSWDQGPAQLDVTPEPTRLVVH